MGHINVSARIAGIHGYLFPRRPRKYTNVRRILLANDFAGLGGEKVRFGPMSVDFAGEIGRATEQPLCQPVTRSNVREFSKAEIRLRDGSLPGD